MDENLKWNAKKVFEVLINGKEEERLRTKDVIAKLKISDQSECSLLSDLIIEALDRDYKKEKDRGDENKQWTRAWLLSSLARISDKSGIAFKHVENYLSVEKEPYNWVRFYALEGLFAVFGAKKSIVKTLTQNIIQDEKEDVYVRMLAVAILASEDDADSFEVIKIILENKDISASEDNKYLVKKLKKINIDIKSKKFEPNKLKKATLLPLRFISVQNISTYIINNFEKKIFNDETYHAINAMGEYIWFN
jgi:HEAT repeat protein